MDKKDRGDATIGFILKNPDIISKTLGGFIKIGCLLIVVVLTCSLLWFAIAMAIGVNS